MGMESTYAYIVTFFVLCGLTCFAAVNILQGEPYMDEIFHVPQAQKYCSNNFTEWDPMITTLPGLYLSSVLLLGPALGVLNKPPEIVCNTAVLRSINFAYMWISIYVLYKVIGIIHKQADKTWKILTALSLGHFPVLYMASFLYYTDTGSVFWVLMMYLWCLKRRNCIAACFGLLAVIFRQTNIVWVVFMAGIAIEKDIMEWIKGCPALTSPNRKVDNSTLQSLFQYVISQKSISCIRIAVCKFLPYAFIVMVFLTFVYVNEGIVVGDKSHHQPCLNFPQLFYFISTCAGFGFCHFLSLEKNMKCFKQIVLHPYTTSLFFTMAFYGVANHTYVHEYLLADNRHYTFYIWSKIFRRYESVKFFLIPLYLFILNQLNMSLSHKSVFWKLMFWTCISVSVIPQKLFEFRYFVIPYFVWRINITHPPLISLWLEMVSVIFINGITMYIFLVHPFKWTNSDQLQRFMW